MLRRLFRIPFTLLKRLLRKSILVREADAIFDGDRNVESLSTLQDVEFAGKERDVFYLQTMIRLCAHIAEKDLSIPTDKPRYRRFARELGERLQGYQGPNIAAIEWAENILQKHENKYGL